MIGQEAPGSPESSAGSGSTREQRQSQSAACRSALGRSTGLKHGSLGEKAEADSGRARRGTGGGVGLSERELEDLYKNDPKRAKRILANRSSAARSKVRKLRYISELETKSARLQEEAASLLEELEHLHDKSVQLSNENEDLFQQAFSLQDHTRGQDLELEQLMKRARAAESRFMQLRQMRSAPAPPRPELMHNPFLDFQPLGSIGDMHDDHRLSLQFPCRSTMPQTLPSIAAVNSMFQRPHGRSTPFQTNEAAPELAVDTHGPLGSREHSDSSGMTGNAAGQNAGLSPNMDPALLGLLTLSPEMEKSRPFLPPLRVFGQEEGLPYGLHGSLPSAESGSSRTMSLRGLHSLATPNNLMTEVGRHRSVSSAASSHSNWAAPGRLAPSMPTLEGPLDSFNPHAQGVLRWPRHYSAPQGIRDF